MTQEIKPRGIIEHLYVHDTSCIVWEILRLRRDKAAIINAAFRDVFADVLTKCLTKPGKFQLVCGHAETLALDWFKDEEGKKRLAEILNQNGLDEYAIEGEAIRRSSSALEPLDRILASLEGRRNRALRCIGEYRYGLAQQLRESSDRVIEGEKVPELEHACGEQRAESASGEQPVEPASSEKAVEAVSDERGAEPPSGEKPVESASSEPPVELVSREQPIEATPSEDRAAA